MKVLIAILNWGLGHATRCIPIINELQRNDAKVYIASDGEALLLLKEEFRDVVFFELSPYNITYKTSNFHLDMALQGGKILTAINKEYSATQRIIVEEKIDRIISDNRYGCYSESIPSVIITHQLQVISKNFFASLLFKKIVKRWLSKFHEIWIPDDPKIMLSGALSRPHDSMKKFYIGLLSRIKTPKTYTNNIYDIAAILSGPEPQRTHFENELLEKSKIHKDKKILIVRGVFADEPLRPQDNNLEVIEHATGNEIINIIGVSKNIICRSGYSSLMDCYCSHIKPIVVPTPGQPEQEYLAKYLADKDLVYLQKQGRLNLSQVFSLDQNIVNYPMYNGNSNELLSRRVQEFLEE